ncbi:MAG TPA: hypothetical protein PKH58_09255 [Paludibacteraceae bacterium]|nr:hypothetical protein [Paludibacteraceae bacterium]
MALDKEFFDSLEKLKNFKTKPELNDFFEVINKLERIGDEIDVEDKETITDSATLIKQAKDLTKKLDVNRDEFAFRTKTQKEFDAVYECIDYLGEHFNSLN